MAIYNSSYGWVSSRYWEGMWNDDDSNTKWLGYSSWCKVYVCADNEGIYSCLTDPLSNCLQSSY